MMVFGCACPQFVLCPPDSQDCCRKRDQTSKQSGADSPCCRKLAHCYPCVWCCDIIYQCFARMECCLYCVHNPTHYACISPCVGYFGLDPPRPPKLVGQWASTRRDYKELSELFMLTGRTRNDDFALITDDRHIRIQAGNGGAFAPIGYVSVSDTGYVKLATQTAPQEVVYKGQIYEWSDTRWKGSTVCPENTEWLFCCFAHSIPVDTTQVESGILYVNDVTLYRKGAKPKKKGIHERVRVYDQHGENSSLISDTMTYNTNSVDTSDANSVSTMTQQHI